MWKCNHALTRPANTSGYLCREFPATGLPDLTKLKPTQYTCEVAICHHSMSEADTLKQAFRFPPSEPTKRIKICWFPLCVLSSICHDCKIKDYSICPFGFPKPWNIIPHLKGHSTNKNPILPEFVCLLLLANNWIIVQQKVSVCPPTLHKTISVGKINKDLCKCTCPQETHMGDLRIVTWMR